MFAFLKTVFAPRKPARPAALGLESLELRDNPAVSGWLAVGPQPEPPTKPNPGWVHITPVPEPPNLAALAGRTGAVNINPQPTPPVRLPAGDRVKIDPQPTPPRAAPSQPAIPFPVFVGAGGRVGAVPSDPVAPNAVFVGKVGAVPADPVAPNAILFPVFLDK